jgi:hypothetical protein
MKKNLGVILAMLLTSSAFLISCSKDEVSNDTTTFHLRLTDAPTALDSVFIDIEEIKVKMQGDSSGSDSGWTTLNTNAGIYNLLELQNGVDTLLAVGTLPTGTLRQVRFILGTENRIVNAGVSYPLTIPSGAESGLKIMINKNLNASLETLLLDFDAALSVHEEQDGFKLRPVIKIK